MPGGASLDEESGGAEDHPGLHHESKEGHRRHKRLCTPDGPCQRYGTFRRPGILGCLWCRKTENGPSRRGRKKYHQYLLSLEGGRPSHQGPSTGWIRCKKANEDYWIIKVLISETVSRLSSSHALIRK